MFIRPQQGNKAIYLMDKIFKNKGTFYCEKVADGFYRGSQPKAQDIIDISRKHGIKTILNLKTISTKELQEMSEIAEKEGIQYINIPLNPYNIKGYISSILNVIKLGTKEQPVFIHCTYGKDRTGFVSGLVKHFKDKIPIPDIVKDMQNHGFRDILFRNMRHKLENADIWERIYTMAT